MCATPHTTIVVGYDGSRAELMAVHWALEKGWPEQHVVIVSTVGQEHSLVQIPAPRGGAQRARTLLEALWLEDTEVLDTEIEMIADRDAPVECLVRVARERGADLLVVGHEHRSGLDGMLHVSVAGRLIEQAPCPVLVVRAPTG